MRRRGGEAATAGTGRPVSGTHVRNCRRSVRALSMDDADRLKRLILCWEKLAGLRGRETGPPPATIEEAIGRIEALVEHLASAIPAAPGLAFDSRTRPEHPPAAGPVPARGALPADDLLRIEEIKNRFLAGISHELRTPLASIKGFAEALLVEPDMPVEQRQRFLRIMSGEAARLATLIEDMLQATIRARAVAEDDASEEHDAAALLETAVENIRAARGGSVPEIRILAAPGLPPVRAWRAGVLEILRHLLDNACKFAAGKPVRITAEPWGAASGWLSGDSAAGGDLATGAAGSPSPAWIKIGVHDEGPGIPPEFRDRLFEKFERFGDEAHTKPGVGLGLAAAKALVENEGGRIWVESQPGRGASFFFTLPSGRS
ncbi:MAG: HAMP domain-containing histidine kinase [Planctomycetota bacterium]|nr:HAMP domain-containing histidine kinase [Planctomycetota bacterium]